MEHEGKPVPQCIVPAKQKAIAVIKALLILCDLCRVRLIVAFHEEPKLNDWRTHYVFPYKGAEIPAILLLGDPETAKAGMTLTKFALKRTVEVRVKQNFGLLCCVGIQIQSPRLSGSFQLNLVKSKQFQDEIFPTRQKRDGSWLSIGPHETQWKPGLNPGFVWKQTRSSEFQT